MSEPQFRALRGNDQEMMDAYTRASETVDEFVSLVGDSQYQVRMVKLRFRNPVTSEQAGEDRFMFIWLYEVNALEAENMLSAEFLEVPNDFSEWIKVNQKLEFEARDIFDWMLIDDEGLAKGGYTIRVMRDRLKTEKEKREYDDYIGITSYEAIEPQKTTKNLYKPMGSGKSKSMKLKKPRKK